MSSLIIASEFPEHPVHRALEELGSKVAEAESRAVADSVDGDPIEIPPVGVFLALAKSVLEGAFVELLPTVEVNAITTAVGQIADQLSSYATSGDIDQLTAINDMLSSAVVRLQRLPMVRSAGEAGAIASTIAAARKQTSAALSALHRQAKSIRSEQAGVRETLKQNKATMDRGLSAFLAKGEANELRLDSLVTAFQDRVATLQQQQAAKFQEQLTESGANAAEALAEDQEEFTNLLADLRTQLNAAANELGVDAAAREARLDAQAKAILDHLSEQEKAAVALVGTIGSTGMTGGYQEQATRARWERYAWSLLAVGSFVGLALIVLLRPEFQVPTLTWPAFLGRALLTATLLGLAGFAGIEVRQSGQVEVKYRRMALELASIEPYLAAFGDADRNRIKELLVQRMFGQSDAVTDLGKPGTAPSAAIVDKVIELIKIVKK